MIRKALEYIVDMAKADVIVVDGQSYSNKDLVRIHHNPKATPLEMNTLTSLIEYIKSNTDYFPARLLVQVVGPLDVRLVSMLDMDRKREVLVNVKGMVPDFAYGRYIPHEEFLIGLLAKFVDSGDRSLLLKFAGTVENGTIAQYSDDGVSQKATIKKGIAGKEDCLIPNPVHLKPYRTFVEVEQPESQFIFRMRDNDKSGAECALFEADGGAWKNHAMNRIKAYLKAELQDYADVITVIS